MPKAVATIPPASPLHNLAAGDLADEHGALCARIADLETRRKAIGAELIRRGVTEIEGALFRCVVVAETVTATVDRGAIEAAMGEAWLARFLKWSKRSAHVKTTARTGAARLAA